jgi:hypothetical protein
MVLFDIIGAEDSFQVLLVYSLFVNGRLKLPTAMQTGGVK